MRNILFVLCSSILFACAHTPSSNVELVSVVKRKAAFELSCSESELKVTELSNGQAMTNGFAATNQKSYGVEGCGKRVSYYAYCTNMMGSENCDAMQSGAVAAPGTPLHRGAGHHRPQPRRPESR